ncbi:hypothetical protein ACIQZG_15555 [Lysinibacillus sp. NPDC096418]|uniref:hypothetical protein n=1 Tax=Lysinibacillus sp. NPDC096418 TaxID=3364138 RepID=UPI00382733C7
MRIDITTNYQYPLNQKLQSECVQVINKETSDVQKITKACVDKLIEDIDRILKGASK